MTSEQAIKDRAKQIDPCAFKSYSGSARRDAQQVALDQARRELERETAARVCTIKCEKCGWSFTPPMQGGCDHKDCEYIPQQRRYSIDEIDRLRRAISRVQPRNYMNRNLKPSVEDQVRTAMLGGVDPQELEDKADLYWEAVRERREARRREREADVARIRAGGYAITPPDAMEVAEKVTAGIPLNSFWRRELANRIEDALRRIGWRK